MKSKIIMIKESLIIIFLLLCFSSYAEPNTSKDKPFIFGAAGITNLDINTSLAQNTNLIDGALDDNGGLFEIGVGYAFNQNYFATINIQKSSLEIADIKNIYGSINYQYPMVNIKPFIGILAGYSDLNWTKRPHIKLINEDLTSSKSLYGFQVGIEKRFAKKYSIFMKYQFIKHNHRIEILNNTSKIDHKSEQNLMIGLKYSFN